MCAAAVAVACRGIQLQSASAFSYVADGSLFGACMQAVQLAEAPGASFTKACATAFGQIGAKAESMNLDCAELAGRASEAIDEHFLGDGRLLCGRLIRERAFAGSKPLAAFAPAQASASSGAFCDVMKAEADVIKALPACAPASIVAPPVSAPDSAFLPVAAVAPARPQATPALRVAETKPLRPVAAAIPPSAPAVVPVVQMSAPQPVPRVAAPQFAMPRVTPQMDEAAQTIASGLFPSFARQVPQALAAGLEHDSLSTAPMSAKVGQQPDLNNGGIWTNLAALLHRTG